MNTRLLLPGGLEGIGRFSEEILKRMVNQHPDVEFSFLFDRAYDERYLYGPNVTPHVIFPPARHALLFVAWFDYAVPRKLKRLQPDVFFSPDGYLSLRTRIPQVVVMHDLAFEHFPENVSRSAAWHYRRYFPRFAEKARHIIAVSEFTRQDIIRQYGTAAEKISVVYNAVSGNFKPLSDPSDRQAVRNQYSDGKPYFHCVSAIHPRKNLDRLIAAFDVFKEQSGSDFKLVLVGRKAWDFEKVIHSYASARHKEDIVFTDYVSDAELVRIYGASNGLCYVPLFEGFGLPLVEAMSCEIPIITSDISSMPEVAGEAALLVDPYAQDSITAAMLQLHAQPELASALVDKGKLQKNRFSWDRSAEQVWNILTNL